MALDIKNLLEFDSKEVLKFFLVVLYLNQDPQFDLILRNIEKNVEKKLVKNLSTHFDLEKKYP